MVGIVKIEWYWSDGIAMWLLIKVVNHGSNTLDNPIFQAILLDHKHFRMLCLGLPPCQKLGLILVRKWFWNNISHSKKIFNPYIYLLFTRSPITKGQYNWRSEAAIFANKLWKKYIWMPLSCKRCSKCAVKMAYLDPVNSIRSQGTNLPKWARCSLREIKISGVWTKWDKIIYEVTFWFLCLNVFKRSPFHVIFLHSLK